MDQWGKVKDRSVWGKPLMQEPVTDRSGKVKTDRWGKPLMQEPVTYRWGRPR